MTDKISVALIGAGAMGGALLKGWLEAGSIDPTESAIFDPAPSRELRDLCGARGVVLNSTSERFDVVVFAVKPQIADDVLPKYAYLAKGKLVISVMAGKTLARISAGLGGADRVVRAMPNLPAAIGKGVSGLYASAAVNKSGRLCAETLMRAVGEIVWVDKETDIDLVTAVSGSGPAYFFLLTEALAEAGEALGLSKDAAGALARATFAGAGGLMASEPRSPALMREAVTSPGGTTAAALKILDGDERALRKLMRDAVAAAAERAKALTE